MTRGTLIAVALALGSIVAPVAAAKDLSRAEVCGQSGCAALPTDDDGDGLIQLRGSEGRDVAAQPRVGPYYRLNWEFSRRVHFMTLYVPSADLVAAQGMDPGSIEWFGASEAVLAKVRGAARGLEPFAAPERWPAELLAATSIAQPAPPTPSTESRDRRGWVFGATAVLVLIGSAVFLARHRAPRLLHRRFSG
jgi:hypothetical protein